MLSREELERYRAMGPEGRFALFLEAAHWSWNAMDADGPELAARRWERIRLEHEAASRKLVEAFRRLS